MASPAARKVDRCASVVAAAYWSLRESISKAGFEAMKNTIPRNPKAVAMAMTDSLSRLRRTYRERKIGTRSTLSATNNRSRSSSPTSGLSWNSVNQSTAVPSSGGGQMMNTRTWIGMKTAEIRAPAPASL